MPASAPTVAPDTAHPTAGPRALPPSAASVLRTLLYYHLFRFPLGTAELHRLADRALDASSLTAALDYLQQQGWIGQRGPYWFLGDPDQVDERREGERRAGRMQARARRRARLIARFPFVRAVALSGTLSKGVLAPGDDVDFFVICGPRRVWLCRTLLMAFKKIVLLNSHRLFCVNYLVDERQLAIPDRNAFTATEIAWLRPLVGRDPARAFFAANAWVHDYLPNWQPDGTAAIDAPPGNAVQSLLELWLGGALGDWLDERCRAMIERHNRRRYRHLPESDFAVALRTSPVASKHHPQHYQRRILERFETALLAFEQRHGVRLRPDPSS